MSGFVHYASVPMQYAAIFKGCKNDNFLINKIIIFFYFLKTYIVGTR